MIAFITLCIILLPLLGAVLTGFGVKVLSPRVVNILTVLPMTIAFLLSLYLGTIFIYGNATDVNQNIYTWLFSQHISFSIGLFIDHLSITMIIVVCFISLLVHIYSIGYMKGDKGYARFFCYISLFTFMMLMLVTANNFLQLFFGWEGVGLVSYLLIGFWFDKESANQGSLKAFIVNRVADLGFVLGIGMVLAYTGSLDFDNFFASVSSLQYQSISLGIGTPISVITLTGFLLFIGAMGKSAQMPFHVWLPESMEGPTPISALIHAATMVTAGVFMLARLSPLYILSPVMLSIIVVVGATTALFTGLLGIVQNDIKRVVAFSTLSQLGYMVAAMGASAFSIGIFHLVTHAMFKALLFLSAGSVIIAMHHEQDMRKMGGLARTMPITYVCFLVGALSLMAIPPFSGFFSKDAIIDAVKTSTLPGSGYAFVALCLGAMVTALYIMRAFFSVFHGRTYVKNYHDHEIAEQGKVITVPLIILAIMAFFIGMLLFKPFVTSSNLWLSDSVLMGVQNYAGEGQFILGALHSWPLWLALCGALMAWFFYVRAPHHPVKQFFARSIFYRVLEKQYGFDAFNERVFVRGLQAVSTFSLKRIEGSFLTRGVLFGIKWCMMRIALLFKKIQTGYLYHYALMMVLGLIALLCWQVFLY